ncbi:GIY-YIG nuclease family protein [Pseudomonas brassicacearum]|uniref:GIY-YIG nuclease family protein n=1 Tax=Pseudomonas brassicacearum TaxID=930166 RepID=A0AAJ3G2S9_9PSED|nr:GIY-YIG nuclease family protein [Pseudomonas brassicacearum]NUT84247.1 GIY-YIG nuclease family protein [Pseudomonas brassicacearum]
MAVLHYTLLKHGGLEAMASPGAGVAGKIPDDFTAAFAGVYVIFNDHTNNIYVGKSGNIKERFEGRMLAVNELGLDSNSLAKTYACAGVVKIWNTPVKFAVSGGASSAVAVKSMTDISSEYFKDGFFRAGENPEGFDGYKGTEVVHPPTYSSNKVVSVVDGVEVDIEAVLVRYFRQIGYGGTMTNSHYMKGYSNPLPYELIIRVDLGGRKSESRTISIPAGGEF